MADWALVLALVLWSGSGAAAALQSSSAPASSPAQNGKPADSSPASSPAPAKQAPPPQDGQTPPPPQGTVLFQSHGQPPEPDADRHPLTAAPELAAPPGESGPQTFGSQTSGSQTPGSQVTDDQRAALTFTAYDLDARLAPATAHLAMRARLTLRNDGAEPLRLIALQVSSTLRWDSATLLSEEGPGQKPGTRPLSLAQHLLDTDADHTGKANEAILTLPAPLGPGKSVTLDTFYSGPIAADAARLERIGASAAQAASSDWDAIAPGATAVRGFGNVLWYPVAAPQLFLGDGARLFQTIGQMRLRERAARIRLRLAVEYRGEAPAAVYFCGRRRDLKAISDDPEAAVATGAGIATAEFAAEPLGFRSPNLIVIARPETTIAPLPAPGSVAAKGRAAESSSSRGPAAAPPDAANPSSSGGPAMLAVETNDEGSLPALAASAERVAPLVQEWLGPRPLSALTVLDHPGQPFEDGPLLLAPIASLAASSAAPALAHSLTHAWIDTGQPWMDEGLAEFVELLWTERELGRAAAQTRLADLLQPLGLTEPAFDSAAAEDTALAAPHAPGQPLIAAGDEIYYRRKAAAVLWMLRGIAGDDPLRLALTAWRTQPRSAANGRGQALAFEKLLEKTSGKDLAWFFHDWVLNDVGLPDLNITDVTPRALPAGPGHDSGWLVAVSVHNDGAAAAEVPVTVRSGTFTTTHRLRIPGFSSATERVLTEAAPTDVTVNDGEVPEIRTSTHNREVKLHSQ